MLVRVPILMLKNHPEILHSRNIRLHKHVSWHLIGLRFCLQIQRHLPWARYICKDIGLESIPGQTWCKNFIDIFSSTFSNPQKFQGETEMSTTSIRVWCNWRSASSPVMSQQFALHVVLSTPTHDLTTWKLPYGTTIMSWFNDDPKKQLNYPNLWVASATSLQDGLYSLLLLLLLFLFCYSSKKIRLGFGAVPPPKPSVKSTSKSSSQPAKAGSHAWIIWSSATNSAQDGSLVSLSQGFDWLFYFKESLSSCANPWKCTPIQSSCLFQIFSGLKKWLPKV